MVMTREMWVWALIAGLAAVWGAVATTTGGGLFLPGLIAGLAVGCVASGDVRRRTEGWMANAFSGSALRSTAILFVALMFIQVLPVELALFAAGDMLAYVEVAAAVGLIAANTRLRPLVQAMAAPFRRLADRLRPRAATGRQARTRSTVRRKAPPSDAEGPAWAFA